MVNSYRVTRFIVGTSYVEYNSKINDLNKDEFSLAQKLKLKLNKYTKIFI